MVRTKVDLKIKIKKWVNERKEPFNTRDVVHYSQTIAPHIRLSPHRLQNYIRSAGVCSYDKSKRKWIK